MDSVWQQIAKEMPKGPPEPPAGGPAEAGCRQDQPRQQEEEAQRRRASVGDLTSGPIRN